MAGVLIATALGASAATAAAVGGGVAAATAIGGGVKSFSEANKAKKRQAKAEREAAKAMEEAKKRLEVNVMERLSIQKEPYEQQVMALLTQGQAGLQAGQEGETRGAAATAGRVQMAQNIGQERVRSGMGQELQTIDRAVAAEEARLLDAGMGLDLGEVAGYQQMAADAQKDRAAYITQGFTALQQGAELGQQMAPLYGAPQNGVTRQERRQRRADARNFVPYAQEQAALAPRSSGLNESIMGGGFAQPQYQSLGFNSGASFGLPTYAQPIYTTQQ
jgi:hypothetical protein